MNHYKKYETIVKDMNIPEHRKTANQQNALWFYVRECRLIESMRRS